MNKDYICIFLSNLVRYPAFPIFDHDKSLSVPNKDLLYQILRKRMEGGRESRLDTTMTPLKSETKNADYVYIHMCKVVHFTGTGI